MSSIKKLPILAVAPMLDWTDRHCRYFHRLLSKNALLYTEMVTTGALIYGDVQRHLQFNAAEQPVVLQLGGSEPAALAKATKLAQEWGYAGVNLNCGCPSDRVQRGAFGACLMREPQLVADCVAAMQDASSLPVSVKHRIGLDDEQSYAFVADFVGKISAVGCQHFDVHARNAWLQGLSPKENRSVPPLKYDFVYRLKQDFPHLTIVLNGGVTSSAEIAQHLQQVDGVMLGRQAYHDPWWLASWDEQFFGAPAQQQSRDDIEQAMLLYMQQMAAQQQVPWNVIAKHMLGLRHGLPGARHWRRVWSDHRLKALAAAEVSALANQTKMRTDAEVVGGC